MYFGALKGDKPGWLTGITVSPEEKDTTAEFTLSLHAGERIWLLTTNAEPGAQRAFTYVIKELRAFRYLTP